MDQKPEKTKGFKKIPLSLTRRMVIASVNGNKKNAIHCLAETDVSVPRKLRQDHFEKTGKKLSFTAYIVRCFAETIKDFPEMNAFIRGRNLILLHDINISVLIEREIDGAKVPEPVGIKNADQKTVAEIHHEIRKAQQNQENKLGSLSGTAWINMIPATFFRMFIRLAESNIKMAKRYGKLAVTAVGMHAGQSNWFIPHGTATAMLTIGSLTRKTVLNPEGTPEARDILNMTVSFDHEIIDGAPAARFIRKFENILSGGELFFEG